VAQEASADELAKANNPLAFQLYTALNMQFTK
jgi:hypothetical protein